MRLGETGWLRIDVGVTRVSNQRKGKAAPPGVYGFAPRRGRPLGRRKRPINEAARGAAREAAEEALDEFRPKGLKPNIAEALDAAKKGLKKGVAKPPVENTGPRRK